MLTCLPGDHLTNPHLRKIHGDDVPTKQFSKRGECSNAARYTGPDGRVAEVLYFPSTQAAYVARGPKAAPIQVTAASHTDALRKARVIK